MGGMQNNQGPAQGKIIQEFFIQQ